MTRERDVVAPDRGQAHRPPAGHLGSAEPGGEAGPGSHYDPNSVIPAPPQSRRHRWLAIVLALLFFFLPALAYAIGQRPHQIENRRLAAFPSLDRGWHFFGDFDRWAIDHLPLRDRAVEGNTKLSEGVFGQQPQYGQGGGDALGPIAGGTGGGGGGAAQQFPKVLAGRDGWLFFGADVQNPCQPAVPLDQTIARVNRLASIVEASGRRFVFVVPPDKTTMEPEQLPGTYVGKKCSEQGRQRFWSRLRTDPPRGYVDLRGPLEAVKAAQKAPIYRPHDSHWAPRGAAVYAEQLADRLDPQLWRTSRLESTGPRQANADLSALLGIRRHDVVPGFDVVRDGVQNVTDTSTRITNTTTGAPLFDPPTLLVGDSFTASAHGMIAPLFRDLTIMHPATAKADPEGLIAHLRSSQVVIVEIVERTLDGDASEVLDPAFLDRLQRELGKR